MNKLKRVGIIILTAFIIGFLMSFLIHEGIWNKLMSGFKAIHILLYPVLVLVSLFLVILIHELGHLISFVVNGIKIRALLVLGLVFKRTKKGFRFQFYAPLVKLVGGLVVPELPSIKNDDEYKEVVNKFSKALIAGPQISLFYGVVTFIVFILTLMLSSSSLLIGLFALNFIITFLLTILVMLSSKIHTSTLYGDFIAHKKMNEDELFQLTQITQYTSFKLEEDLATTDYLINKIGKYIIANPSRYNLFTMNLYAQYISMVLYSDKNHYNDQVNNKISAYRINRLINNKYGLELAYLISAYFYKLKNVEKAYEIYNNIKKANKSLHEEKDIYQMELKYSHLMNLANNSIELVKEDVLFSDDLWLLKPILDENDLKEEALYQLPFVEYYTEIHCIIEKLS